MKSFGTLMGKPSIADHADYNHPAGGFTNSATVMPTLNGIVLRYHIHVSRHQRVLEAIFEKCRREIEAEPMFNGRKMRKAADPAQVLH